MDPLPEHPGQIIDASLLATEFFASLLSDLVHDLSGNRQRMLGQHHPQPLRESRLQHGALARVSNDGHQISAGDGAPVTKNRIELFWARALVSAAPRQNNAVDRSAPIATAEHARVNAVRLVHP